MISQSLLSQIPTPAFMVDCRALERNLKTLDAVQKETGCKILLALKGFAMFHFFPLVRQYLHGICASSVDEARLGREEFGREVHAFAPAYSDEQFRELLTLCDHIVFNSFAAWRRFRGAGMAGPKHIEFGIRINPEYSEIEVPLYNPCYPRSRLGVKRDQFEETELDGISGLHFHTHCEQNSDVLERTLVKVEEKFGPWFRQMKWVNFGGGHHITRPDYDVDRLCRCITNFADRYGVQVYLEPGEAVGLNAGVLVASVLDIVENEIPIAILDTSASTHMPDVLEMPYRPRIVGGAQPGKQAHTYRLGGLSCLAGDVIGDYSFAEPLQVGDKLVFEDMAHYSMVKTTTFNGVRLPSIGVFDSNADTFEIVRKFGYEDYKNRLS